MMMKLINYLMMMLMFNIVPAGGGHVYRDEANADGSDAGGAGTDSDTSDGDAGSNESTEGDTGKGSSDGDNGSSDSGGESGTAEPVVVGDYSISAPEGMTVDQGLLEAVAPVAKENGVSNEQLQALSNAFGGVIAARAADAQAQYQQAAEADFNAQVDEWKTARKADKELSGDNEKDTNRLTAVALSKYGTPELSEFLSKFGLNEHPEMIRMLKKVGADSAEDTGTGGTAPKGEPKSAEDILYG